MAGVRPGRGAGWPTREPAGRPLPGRPPRTRPRTGPRIGGEPCRARTTSTRQHAARPAWVAISRRRRSTASASEPAPSANSRMGMSWKSVERRDREGRPGQDVDLVRQRDPGDLVADAVDDLAGPQPAVVTVDVGAARCRGRDGGRDRPRPTTARSAVPSTGSRSVCPWVANPVSPGSVAGHDVIGRRRRPHRVAHGRGIVDSATTPIRPTTAARIRPSALRRDADPAERGSRTCRR